MIKSRFKCALPERAVCFAIREHFNRNSRIPPSGVSKMKRRVENQIMSFRLLPLMPA